MAGAAPNEPGGRPAILASEPGRPVGPPAKEPGQRPGLRANEPKEPAHAWPVLSDAKADRIEAMIASGDDTLLEEAARRLGMLDGKTLVPPSLRELYESKLAG